MAQLSKKEEINMLDQGFGAKNQSAAEQVNEQCSAVAKRIEALFEDYLVKLSPVVFPETPWEVERAANAVENFPPLFQELRASIDTIDLYLDKFQELLGRVAL